MMGTTSPFRMSLNHPSLSTEASTPYPSSRALTSEGAGNPDPGIRHLRLPLHPAHAPQRVALLGDPRSHVAVFRLHRAAHTRQEKPTREVRAVKVGMPEGPPHVLALGVVDRTHGCDKPRAAVEHFRCCYPGSLGRAGWERGRQDRKSVV